MAVRSFYIYNYANKRKLIQTGKDIMNVWVEIYSGDEIVRCKYSDGTEENFDAAKVFGDPRVVNDFDGAYFVGNRLVEWAAFNKTSRKPEILSYKRKYEFFLDGNDEDEEEEE